MKNLLFGLIATVLFGFIGNANNLSEIEKPTKIKHLDPTYVAVSKLITESARVWSQNEYTSFFNSEMSELLEKNPLSESETIKLKALYEEGLQRMTLSDSNLSNSVRDVQNLNISKEDFKKNIDLFFANNPSYRALIPNKKACARSTGIYYLSYWGYPTHLAYIGMLIHC